MHILKIIDINTSLSFYAKNLDFVTAQHCIAVSDWKDRLLPNCNVLGPLDTNCCPLPRHSNCSLIPAATQPLSARFYDNLLDLIRTIELIYVHMFYLRNKCSKLNLSLTFSESCLLHTLIIWMRFMEELGWWCGI